MSLRTSGIRQLELRRRGEALTDPRTITDLWKAEAAADLGLSPSEMVFIPSGGDSALLTGNWITAIATGGANRAYSENGLCSNIQTNAAGSGGICQVSPTAVLNGTFQRTHSPSPVKWWMKFRGRVNPIDASAGTNPGAVGAGTVIGMMVRSSLSNDGTHEMAMGVDGAASLTNFVLTGTGTTIDSGVAIDALVRDHKSYFDGSLTRYCINGVLVGTPGTVNVAAASRAALTAFDSAAVQQRLQYYVAAVAFPVRALGA